MSPFAVKPLYVLLNRLSRKSDSGLKSISLCLLNHGDLSAYLPASLALVDEETVHAIPFTGIACRNFVVIRHFVLHSARLRLANNN